MWFNTKLFWNRFPYMLTTLVFVVAMVFNAIVYGVGAFSVTFATFLIAVAIVSHVNKRRRAAFEEFEKQIKCANDRCGLIEGCLIGEVETWFRRYLSVRQDRAAFFKALTAVFPAGYREEWYIVEMPTRRIAPGYRNDQDVQLFLYIDLPEELDLPHHQLRFAISETERKIIGPLPEYNKQRITLMESDSQQTLRLYLANEAYESLKEKEDVATEPAGAQPA